MDSSPFRVDADTVTMIGLDFGSTTSSALVAEAVVGRSAATGRMVLGEPRIRFRSEPVFTPFSGDAIDGERLLALIDQWIAESGVTPESLFAGAAIVTGLAATRRNAAEIARMVNRRIGEAVMATADDPCLESWLAFMGSAAAISRQHPDRPVINLDIGGGTTNPAMGSGGRVVRTGCCFIGARHFCFEPGSYRLTEISKQGRWLLGHLGIGRGTGDILPPEELATILKAYVTALEEIVAGVPRCPEDPVLKQLTQVPFSAAHAPEPVITFSGGVGELIYSHVRGVPLPGTTCYGDLGVDLARAVLSSPVLAAGVRRHMPAQMGRATVYGLTLHSTEISGTTLFISHPDRLPRRDLPIVSRIPLSADAAAIASALALIRTSRGGGAIQLDPVTPKDGVGAVIAAPPVERLERIRAFGRRVAAACESAGILPEQPLVLLAPHNYGHVLGNYVTEWRKRPLDLIVIDEMPRRQAHFVNIGRPRNNVVPVSFYGIYDPTGNRYDTTDSP